MNINIILSETQVKGIKSYLTETSGHKATAKEVKQYIYGIVTSTIYNPHEAISDYINFEENKSFPRTDI
jgi:hypothetical protein